MGDELTLFDLEPMWNEKVEVPDLMTSAGLLALKTLPHIGDARALRLATTFRTSESFNEADPSKRREVAGVPVEDFVRVDAVDVREGLRRTGFFDAEYPEALKTIPNPPAVLWSRGRLPRTEPCIAVVGTRSATEWGVSMARAISSAATKSGIGVVSGLALGIDIAAHRSVLDHDGYTVAVLGSGVDSVTPRGHVTDAERILEGGGAIVSEQPPGAPPNARTLVARNRLQAGLSRATVLIQCGEKSGTMSTAKFTRQQARTLALPVPPEHERTHTENQGSARLAESNPPPVLLRTEADLEKLLESVRSPMS